MEPEVIPAILVKRREDLLEHISRVKGLVSTVHIDVMDNEFVPNATVGPDDFKGLPSDMKYEFHWMVKQPEKWIEKVPGKHLHVVHIEAVEDWNAIKAACKKAGGTLGIAISPATPLTKLEPVMKDVSMILVMSVTPGFDGQKYIQQVEGRLRELKNKYPKMMIEIDGGIGPATAGRAASAGADRLAAASAIYAQPDAKKAIQGIRDAAKKK